MVYLLDINVLLALIFEQHAHHQAAHEWREAKSRFKWATTPGTQSGFLRIAMQPAVVKANLLFGDAAALLRKNIDRSSHQFWPEDISPADALEPFSKHILGHRQITDALLWSTARRHRGTLATFDKNMEDLLPMKSDFRRHLEVIPAF